MKKRLLAVLMAAVMGTCAVPAYASGLETVGEAAMQAEKTGSEEEAEDADVLTQAETVMNSENAARMHPTMSLGLPTHTRVLDSRSYLRMTASTSAAEPVEVSVSGAFRFGSLSLGSAMVWPPFGE